MDGRVKTLHPNIHGGLLARRDLDSHLEAAKDNQIELIDLVVVNLYPFKETILKPDVTYADAVENIDIGGPSMLRSAAKNHASVTVVVDLQTIQWFWTNWQPMVKRLTKRANVWQQKYFVTQRLMMP